VKRIGAFRRSTCPIPRAQRVRRLWPIYVEAVVSTLWSYLLVALIAVWALAYPAHVLDFGSNPIPNFWGMVIASVAVAQISCGLWLDGRYDRRVRRYGWWLPLYPLVYWAMTALVAVRATGGGLLRRPTGAVTWTQQRYGPS
jgi:biofilm PGA synthesis N-glycosyltransferase PgaC